MKLSPLIEVLDGVTTELHKKGLEKIPELL